MLEYTNNCSGKFNYVEMDENFGRVKSVNYEHNGIFVTLEGIELGCDLEGALKLRSKKNITVRPYI
jgi:hypothetical protein